MSLRWSSATDQLYAVSNSSPSLDLDFASNKSLLDNISGNNLITFSRASSGTYVGSDGLIKTSPVNLVTYSEQFDQWTVGLNTTVSPNVAVAPDGTQTADRLQNGSQSSTFVGNGTINNGVTYTVSVYAKAVTPGTNDKFTLNVGGDTANSSSQFTTTSEWQRFVFTRTVSSVSPTPYFFINNEGDGFASDIYIWGAQLEEGSTATDYIPTTTTISGAPRFDHDPVTSESLGLLIEEERTNSLEYSEQFDQWTAGSNSVITPNATTAPDGTLTADTVFLAELGGTFISQSVTLTQGKVYTFSVYAKAVTPGSDNEFIPYISSPTPRFPVNSLEATSEWVRFSFTFTHTDNTASTGVFLSNRADAYTTNVHFWGAQLEEGSFATSYIPTSSSAVTRAADVASITGTNFSSWYNQSEGTVFVREDSYAYNNTSALPTFAHFTDGTLNNYIRLNGGSAYVVRNFTNTGGVTQTQTNIGLAPTDNTRYSIALGIAANNARLYADGNSTATVNPYLLPVVNKLEIGAWVSQSNTYLNGHISRLAYYPYRLSDTILQEITS